jgi:hypothetical protein
MHKGKQPRIRQFRLEDGEEKKGRVGQEINKRDCGKKDMIFDHSPAL